MTSESAGPFAMFMVGFTLLMPLRVAMSCAKYAIVRYKLPMEKLGLFINLLHNPMELSCFIGIAISNVVIWCTTSLKDLPKHTSTVTNWLMFIFNVILYFAYRSGGELGNLTLYYWTLIAFTFIYGVNLTFSLKVDSSNASLATAGLPLSGIFVFVYHYIYLSLAAKFNGQNVEYYLVSTQIYISILLSLVSAFLWTLARYACGNADNGQSSASSGGGSKQTDGSISELFTEPKCWSPLLMCVFSSGFTYIFYPVIAPYQLIDSDRAYKIDLVAVVVYAIPPLVLSILDQCKKGPGSKWEGASMAWNLMWILGLIAFICMVIFTRTMHYPNTILSNAVHNNTVLVGILSVGFVTCQETLKTAGFSGVGKQGSGSNGSVTAVGLFLGNCIMNITMFISDGYLKTYRKCNRECWPTEGYSGWSGFWFWVGCGAVEAKKALSHMITSDVRRMFLKLSD